MVSPYSFELPDHAIARHPSKDRDASRLMHLDAAGASQHLVFKDVRGLLRPGDVLVLNDSRVIPARLEAQKAQTRGAVEVLLVEPLGSDRAWSVMTRSSKGMQPGTELIFEDGSRGVILEVHARGFSTLRLERSGLDLAKELGQLPLPPYMRRDAEQSDGERYQTVYARAEGSVAAPTAGLHFTASLLDAVREDGVDVRFLTLHVGPGTFLPVHDLETHVMHGERFEVSAETAKALNDARADGRRVVAVGTTSTRVLESFEGEIRPGPGRTDIFIKPGHPWRWVDALVTNFHLPESTLLMLVASFAGRESILAAYAEAVREGYRFYSYGDAMFLERAQ